MSRQMPATVTRISSVTWPDSPMWPGRTYTPEMALPEEMAALHRALHIDRVVIVTPSIYGTDNSATVYGIKARGAQACGVAVIGEKTPEKNLDMLDGAGIRGIRLNLATAGQTDRRAARLQFRTALDRTRKRGWHIQIYASLAQKSMREARCTPTSGCGISTCVCPTARLALPKISVSSALQIGARVSKLFPLPSATHSRCPDESPDLVILSNQLVCVGHDASLRVCHSVSMGTRG